MDDGLLLAEASALFIGAKKPVPGPAGSAAVVAAPSVEDNTSSSLVASAADTSTPSTGMLALPAPEDVNSLITLDVSTGQAVTLDHMGPVVVNTDGTLSRITNWARMTKEEQDVTKRRIAKRNVERLKEFRDKGELKDELVGALGGEKTQLPD
jgi:hypothetical protein